MYIGVNMGWIKTTLITTATTLGVIGTAAGLTTTRVDPQHVGAKVNTLTGTVNAVDSGLAVHLPNPLAYVIEYPRRNTEKAFNIPVVSSDGQSYEIPISFYWQVRDLPEVGIKRDDPTIRKMVFDYPNYDKEMERIASSAVVNYMGGVPLFDVPVKAAENEKAMREEFLKRLEATGMPIQIDTNRINFAKPQFDPATIAKLTAVADAQRAVRSSELGIQTAENDKKAAIKRAEGQASSVEKYRPEVVKLARELTEALGGDTKAAAQIMTFTGPDAATMPLVVGGNGMLNLSDTASLRPEKARAGGRQEGQNARP
jgi:regulator of protease activity HflC (stomatin/prohibitin superfamily)